jgi:hypothetical protein
MLESPESEAHVFQFLYERMETGPALVIYDRGCKLHVYSLKREPWFFRNTVFRIDALHYRGHVGCSEGYDPRVYRQPQAHSSSKQSPWTNTEAAEQANACMKKIKNHVAFMTQDNYLWYLRWYLGRYNARKMGK